jgi:hypothetical protein
MNLRSFIPQRLRMGLILSSMAGAVCCGGAAAWAGDAVAIGSRRELFVDGLLVGELKNTALKLHEPQLMPPVSQPRPQGQYATVLRAQDKFQFYYRGDKDPKVTWKTDGIEAYHGGRSDPLCRERGRHPLDAAEARPV